MPIIVNSTIVIEPWNIVKPFHNIRNISHILNFRRRFNPQCQLSISLILCVSFFVIWVSNKTVFKYSKGIYPNSQCARKAILGKISSLKEFIILFKHLR